MKGETKMKTGAKIFCMTALISGAFLLGGAAAAVLMKFVRIRRHCDPVPCEDDEELTDECIQMQESDPTEVECDEECEDYK